MNHKERVRAALAHKEPDRVPFDLGGINNTTMHRDVEGRLCELLGLPAGESRIIARDQQIVVPREDLLRHLDTDTRCVYIEEAFEWKERDGVFYDQYGIGRRYDGHYYTMCSHPLAQAETVGDIEAYELPDPRSERRLAGLVEEAKKYGGEYFMILEGLREVSFGLPSWIRGMQNFYMDLLINTDMAACLLDKVLRWELELAEFVLDRLHPYLDMVKIADDLGSQQSLLLSPETYRDLIKPCHQKLIAFIKDRYKLPVLLHSCGAVRPLIPDFIEIGVDALNPVQVSAAGMERKGLKKDFGDKICLWGGGIDTQETLPKGSRTEIDEDVHRALEVFKPGGGYVFSQVHNITPEVPAENVLFMYEAFKKYSAY
jgi:uroporphyrinogen decarboxylase